MSLTSQYPIQLVRQGADAINHKKWAKRTLQLTLSTQYCTVTGSGAINYMRLPRGIISINKAPSIAQSQHGAGNKVWDQKAYISLGSSSLQCIATDMQIGAGLKKTISHIRYQITCCYSTCKHNVTCILSFTRC